MIDADALASMIAPARTALVVVDVQVDFVSPDGALAAFGLDMTPLAAPLGRVEALVDAARHAGVPVVFLRLVTRPGTDSAALVLRNARLGQPPGALDVCRAGTPGAGYLRVQPRTGDVEIEKTLYSGFHGTSLHARLRGLGVDTLVVCGFTTECCVADTVRDAFHRDFHCFVVADATGAYSQQLHDGALEAMALNHALLADSHGVCAAWPATP